MKASEKEKLYNLLKTASSWAQGFTPQEFLNEKTEFEDDFEEILPLAEKPLANAPLQKEVPPENEKNISFSNEEKLSNLNAKIRSCTNCILSRTSALPFAGKGVTNPSLLVIGDAPMEDKDKNLSSFTEETEVLLTKMLSAISLSSDTNCFITTAVKCLPPQNRSPMKDELDSCAGFLQAQICYLKPKMILVMGRCAAQNILKSDEMINRLRGRFLEYQGLPLMVTYSPQQVLLDAGLKRPVWEDLKMVRSRLLELDKNYDSPFRKKILEEK